MDISSDAHMRDGDTVRGSASTLGSDVYPVLSFRSENYPCVTIYPAGMGHLLEAANAALDALVAMVGKGAEIDGETGEALARLSARAHALAFDEEAEAQASEAVAE